MKPPVAVITGATGGIGKALVEKFLQEGCLVYATDFDKAKLVALHKELHGKFPERIFTEILDVRDRESIEAAERKIAATGSPVDILINNAGVFENTKLSEMTETAFQRLLDVNLTGSFRVTQVFSRGMMERNAGKIIGISSVAGIKGAPSASHYAASKAGLTAFSLSLAAELAPYNIQVNVVVPGFIDTPMMTGYRQALQVIAAWKIPSKRLGLPWEVAEAAWYLASAKASYLTGATLTIDGGLTLG